MNGLWAKVPAWQWLSTYSRKDFGDDLLASVIVTIMLIPQSLAYALLAGLPPEAGLYASMLPLVVYAVLGSSRVLAVGPVAVLSLMTASALGAVVGEGESYALAAMTLALLSGGFLLLLGVLRLGFIANFLSHAVITGFVAASGVLIAISQLSAVLALPGGGHNVVERLASLLGQIDQTHGPTAIVGFATMALLLFARSRLAPLLKRLGVSAQLATYITRGGPVVAVVLSIWAVGAFDLIEAGVAVVGVVPQGLPALELALPSLDLALRLLPAAVLLSLVGFVESISVAQSLAMRRRQQIFPNQELLGLGAANVAAGLAGGFPVTGGFTRSVVNFDAGAVTPFAGVLTAGFMALTAAFLTPLFHDLPKAVLAATIIIAVISLIDVPAMVRTLRQSPQDFAAMAATIVGVLALGVELGISCGVLVALGLHLGQSSRPHMAIVGRVPGTEHFRNIDRHEVETDPRVLSVRVDESLYFANARFLEDQLLAWVTARPEVEDVVLLCSAVNGMDGSAVETLESLNARLRAASVRLHLSEVKGPVMDRLRRTHLLTELTGEVFFTHHRAMTVLLGREAAPAPEGALPA